MAETIAGITVPDSALVREATELVRDTTDDLLYDHSRRVFFFGALQGRKRGLEPDHELLYIGAMFHDLGLTDRFGTDDRRFEVDGAMAARDFVAAQGLDDEAQQTVWLAIALHTTSGVPEHLSPVVALVTAGVETDVLGIGYDALTDTERDAVTSAHPRPDFKNRILEAFARGNAHRPGTTFGNVNADVLAHFDPDFQREDFVEMIRANPWPE